MTALKSSRKPRVAGCARICENVVQFSSKQENQARIITLVNNRYQNYQGSFRKLLFFVILFSKHNKLYQQTIPFNKRCQHSSDQIWGVLHSRVNTLTCTPVSCKARKLTRFNLVSWKVLCALIGSFVYDDPRRQEHKQNTAIGRTWLVRLCTMIREAKNINKTPPLEERDWFVSQFVQ